jgi:hypothetical protein
MLCIGNVISPRLTQRLAEASDIVESRLSFRALSIVVRDADLT